MSHLRTGIKPDTLTALRTAPLHIPTLFPDSAIKRAEEDIAQFESKGHSGSTHSKDWYHPYERQDKMSNNRDSNQISQHGRVLPRDTPGMERVFPPLTHPDQPRTSSRINDNYCVTKLQPRLLAGSNPPRQTIDTFINVNLPVVKVVPTSPGHSQKRDLSPGLPGCYTQRKH